MQRPSVLLLFGGESSEHDVSIASARNVYGAIDKEKFQVILAFIDTKGRWWLLPHFGGAVTTKGAARLAPVLGSGTFVTFPHNRIIKADVILPILHGKNGEDGSVQGLGQLLHIPVVGCDLTASSICMDKLATKEILASQGVPIVPYAVHKHYEPFPDFGKLAHSLGTTLFVKPARAGSSIGVSKVVNELQLRQALVDAHEHDETALIERAISARELEVAVMGNPPHHKVSGVGEVVPDDEFYSYSAKYSSANISRIDIPAHLEKAETEAIRKLAGKVYRTLGCQGLARIDFFMDEKKHIYVNEINTLPGFTNISMFPKLWQQAGVAYPKLISYLIQSALAVQ